MEVLVEAKQEMPVVVVWHMLLSVGPILSSWVTVVEWFPLVNNEMKKHLLVNLKLERTLLLS